MKKDPLTTRQKLLKRIDELTNQIEEVGGQIEHERNESSEDDSAIKQELLDKKEILEQQISELKSSLALSSNSGEIGRDIGKTFSIEINGSKRDLAIVLPAEADPSKGKISIDSPLARALLGHKKGDMVAVETPAGVQTYKITRVS